jgi:single-stranded DNA-binding protein
MLLAHDFVILSGRILANQLKLTENSALCDLILRYTFVKNREPWTANIPVTIWGEEAAQAAHQNYPIGSYAIIEGYLETFVSELTDGKKQTNSHIVATYIYPSLPETQINRVILIGNPGDAPACRTFENGSTVSNLNLAVQKPTKQGATEAAPYWFGVEAWGKTGEILQQHVKKGRRISLLGQMTLPRKNGHSQRVESQGE